jgi:hypothetical protein
MLVCYTQRQAVVRMVLTPLQKRYFASRMSVIFVSSICLQVPLTPPRFLGTFGKLRKSDYSLHVRQSIQMEQLGPPLVGFA